MLLRRAHLARCVAPRRIGASCRQDALTEHSGGWLTTVGSAGADSSTIAPPPPPSPLTIYLTLPNPPSPPSLPHPPLPDSSPTPPSPASPPLRPSLLLPLLPPPLRRRGLGDPQNPLSPLNPSNPLSPRTSNQKPKPKPNIGVEPHFPVQRHWPAAGDVEQKNADKPKVGTKYGAHANKYKNRKAKSSQLRSNKEGQVRLNVDAKFGPGQRNSGQ